MPTVTDIRSARQYPDPIPGVIPFGTVTLFVGSPLSGKTIELTDLACRLRDGRSFCGHPTNKQHVGLITTDHYWDVDQGYWFTRAGWPDVPHVSLRDEGAGPMDWQKFVRSPAERLRVLRLALDKLALRRGGTVLIDVVQPFITHAINDYGLVAAGLCALSEVIRKEFRLTCIGTGHMGKQRQGQQYLKVQERIVGSVGLIGFSDCMIALEGPSLSSSLHTLSICARRQPVETHRLRHDPITGLFRLVRKAGVVPKSESLNRREREIN